jgi:hypothetical protein
MKAVYGILTAIFSMILIVAFYAFIFFFYVLEETKRTYFTVFGIPYYTFNDKMHNYYKRK